MLVEGGRLALVLLLHADHRGCGRRRDRRMVQLAGRLHGVMLLVLLMLGNQMVVELLLRGGRREHGMDRGRLHRAALVLLLALHPPILEPDLDLALGERQRMSDLDAPLPAQVLVVVELFLELQSLVSGVGLSGSLAARAGLWLLHPGVNVALGRLML